MKLCLLTNQPALSIPEHHFVMANKFKVGVVAWALTAKGLLHGSDKNASFSQETADTIEANISNFKTDTIIENIGLTFLKVWEKIRVYNRREPMRTENPHRSVNLFGSFYLFQNNWSISYKTKLFFMNSLISEYIQHLCKFL